MTDTPTIPTDVDPRHVRAMLQLLGPARMVLDRYADTLGDSPGLPGASAADMAQRIVDWIGHPVTDEPAWATLPCVAETDAGDACRTCRPCVARMAAGYEPGLVDGAPVVDPDSCARWWIGTSWFTPDRADTDRAAERVRVEYALQVLDDGVWRWCLTDQDRMRTPADVLDTLRRARANYPAETYRAAIRPIPPWQPLTDERLTAMAGDTK